MLINNLSSKYNNVYCAESLLLPYGLARKGAFNCYNLKMKHGEYDMTQLY